ncbi:hypothetical protein C8Q77DRAFT_784239 [Trametes polyzona]|nr:hypothetical protein C8Q77DRAFT_784239 [Trametes polyzona]
MTTPPSSSAYRRRDWARIGNDGSPEAGCVALPLGHPMAEERLSLPHTPTHSPTATRLLGGGLLSLPPHQTNSPHPVPVPLNATNATTTANGDMKRKWAQEDQDQTDEQERKKAMNDLVQSWMDRLQLISVITTFFAAMEAQLLGSTMPEDPDNDPIIDQVANATLTGALVVHVFAAIISFLAAFFLIRYKLTVAKREEHQVESGLADGARPAEGSRESIEPSLPPIFSSYPHLEQVGPFHRGQPPTYLLDHCHSLSMWLAAVGFVLALAGVLCFAWARFALSSSVFATVCMVVCLVSGVAAVFWPPSSVHAW